MGGKRGGTGAGGEAPKKPRKSIYDGRDSVKFAAVDAALVTDPEHLVGKTIKVYWQSDDAWYHGSVTGYQPGELTHRVDYRDGESEVLLLAKERVQFVASQLEGLPPAKAAHLSALAAHLAAMADARQAQATQAAAARSGRTGRLDGAAMKEVEALRRRALEVEQAASDAADAEAAAAADGPADAVGAEAAAGAVPDGAAAGPAAQRPKPSPLVLPCRLQGQPLPPGPGAAPGMDASAAERDKQYLLASWESFAASRPSLQQFHLLDVALRLAPEALVGRQVRVYWDGDDAWYLGTCSGWDPVSGKHSVAYVDCEVDWLHMGVEEVRLLMRPGEVLPPPSAEQLRGLAASLRAAARDAEAQAAGGVGSPAKEGAKRAARMRSRADVLDKAAAELCAAGGPPPAALGVFMRCALPAEQRPAEGAAEHAGGVDDVREASSDGADADAADLPMEEKATDAEPPAQAHAAAAAAMQVDPSPGAAAAEAGQGEVTMGEAAPAVSGSSSGEEQAVPPGFKQPGSGVALPPVEAGQVCAEEGGEGRQEAAPAEASPAQPQALPPLPDVPSCQVEDPSGELYSLMPGDVAWAAMKGWPDWPVTVITDEHMCTLDGRRPGSSASSHVCVTFFGTYNSARMPASTIVPFKPGVLHNLHMAAAAAQLSASGSSRSKDGVVMNKTRSDQFRRSMCEVVGYLRDGELPDQMVPLNNDEWVDGDEDDWDGEAAGKGRGKASRPAWGPYVGPMSANMPLHLGSNMRITCLGAVEWLNPAFHNEKFIWPVGYRAERLAATPASGKQEALHVMEILRSPDGLGPLFRVTLAGQPALEAASANKAWALLYACDPASQVKALQRGNEAFGLTHNRVRRGIQALPGAVHCERYCNWGEGEAPPGAGQLPPLSEHEQTARLAITTQQQALPPEIKAVGGSDDGSWPSSAGFSADAPPGACDVCGEETECEGSYLLECDGCGLLAHMDCYGMHEVPDGRPWLCDICHLRPYGLTRPPPCALCPVLGGALKRTTDGRWAHLTCALWIPEIGVENPETMSRVENCQFVSKARLALTCSICRQHYGACIQCAGDRKCVTAFHPLCARRAGYAMVLAQDSSEAPGQQQGQQQQGQQGQQGQQHKGHGGGSGAPAACPPLGPAQQQPVPLQATLMDQPLHAKAGAAAEEAPALAPSTAPPAEEGLPAAAAGAEAAVPAPPVQPAKSAASRAAAPSSSHPKRSCFKEGTAAGDGMRRLAFCPKHTHVAAQHRAGAQGLAAMLSALGGAASNGNMLAPGVAAKGKGSKSKARKTLQQLQPIPQAKSQGALQAGQAPTCTAKATSVVRPPDAAAEAERPLSPAKRAAAAGAARCLPYNPALRRGPREPDAVEAAASKRTYIANTMYLTTGLRQHAALKLPCPKPKPAAVAGCTWMKDEKEEEQEDEEGKEDTEVAAQAPDVQPLAVNLAAALRPCAPPASLAQRFAAMRSSLTRRITAGKSAIHGWGAFAKVGHAAGDMVVEYAGEVVRGSVADLREAAAYNDIVGAGTYIFRMDKDVCVDATTAGNIAHLLNHSCAPNCYSRTISLRCGEGASGQLQDHVVIVAKRIIAPGEELTYDYRFHSEELLPCNCGAPGGRCRGHVNLVKPGQGYLGGMAPAGGAAQGWQDGDECKGAVLLTRAQLARLMARKPAAAAAATAAAATPSPPPAPLPAALLEQPGTEAMPQAQRADGAP